jgi:hypothetical protein
LRSHNFEGYRGLQILIENSPGRNEKYKISEMGLHYKPKNRSWKNQEKDGPISGYSEPSHVASSLLKLLRRNIILVDKSTKASVYTHHL